MAKYRITDRIPVWIDYFYTVEADSKEEAEAIYEDGDYDEAGYELSENIAHVDHFVTVEPVEG